MGMGMVIETKNKKGNKKSQWEYKIGMRMRWGIKNGKVDKNVNKKW